MRCLHSAYMAKKSAGRPSGHPTQVIGITLVFGAGDGIRTHDPNLGKVVDNGLPALTPAYPPLPSITFPLILH